MRLPLLPTNRRCTALLCRPLRAAGADAPACAMHACMQGERFINAYHNISNIILLISKHGVDHMPAVLLVAHHDSPVASPGACVWACACTRDRVEAHGCVQLSMVWVVCWAAVRVVCWAAVRVVQRCEEWTACRPAVESRPSLALNNKKQAPPSRHTWPAPPRNARPGPSAPAPSPWLSLSTCCAVLCRAVDRCW